MPHRCAGHSATVISLHHGLAVALHSTDWSCRASVKMISQVADAIVSNAQNQSMTLGCKEAQASHTAQTARDSLTPSPNAQNGPAPCLPRKHGRCGCTPCKRRRPTTLGTLAEKHRNVCRIQHSIARRFTKAHQKLQTESKHCSEQAHLTPLRSLQSFRAKQRRHLSCVSDRF